MTQQQQQQQQQLLVQEQKFDKLWKILDDCIRTGKYKQIRYKLSDGEHGRCVLGVIGSYLGYDDEIKNKIVYAKLFNILREKFNFLRHYEQSPEDREVFEKDKDNYMKYMKYKYGGIKISTIAYLNDNGYSFEQIRDMLKEIDA